MEKKALVVDLDGTLLNSEKKLSQATKEKIWEMMDMGHILALASGRPTPGMRPIEQALELERRGGYLLSFNGGRVLDCRTGEVIYEKTLMPQVAPGLYAFARMEGCGLLTVFGETVLSAFAPDEFTIKESTLNKLPLRHVENFLQFVDFPVNKYLMTAPPDKAGELEKKLQARYGESLGIYRSEPYFIEIMPRGVDKGSSIEKLFLWLGIPQERVVACGDGYNDITMLEYVGVGVAMGNAQEAVKARADYIADTNDRDGIVGVIDKYFLGE